MKIFLGVKIEDLRVRQNIGIVEDRDFINWIKNNPLSTTVFYFKSIIYNNVGVSKYFEGGQVFCVFEYIDGEFSELLVYRGVIPTYSTDADLIGAILKFKSIAQRRIMIATGKTIDL